MITIGVLAWKEIGEFVAVIISLLSQTFLLIK